MNWDGLNWFLVVLFLWIFFVSLFFFWCHAGSFRRPSLFRWMLAVSENRESIIHKTEHHSLNSLDSYSPGWRVLEKESEFLLRQQRVNVCTDLPSTEDNDRLEDGIERNDPYRTKVFHFRLCFIDIYRFVLLKLQRIALSTGKRTDFWHLMQSWAGWVEC